jgi:hypothetical protein
MIFPDLFVVLSMLNIFLGIGSSFIPNPIFRHETWVHEVISGSLNLLALFYWP